MIQTETLPNSENRDKGIMYMGRLSASVKISLILFLLGVWAVCAPPATAQDETLTGWFSMTIADYPTESGLASEITYALTEDSGERYELLIDIELMQPLGGPMALNRKRVTVMGEWEEVGPEAPEQFWVYSIDFAVSPSTASPEGTFAPDLFSDEAPPPRAALPAAATNSHVRGSLPWVTILCRYADATNITPHPVSYYEELMGSSYPGLDHYWREVSYGRINLTGSVVVGWYNLPRPRSYYGSSTAFDWFKVLDDCTAVADAQVFFPHFYGVNIILNQAADYHPDAGGANGVMLRKDGRTRRYGITWLPGSGPILDTWAHEMGHAFGLLHSSGPYGQNEPLYGPSTYDSPWDVMSGGGICQQHIEYDCIGAHTISYHKDFLGWIPRTRKYVPRPNSTRTITLQRLAQPDSEGYLMAQIPIGNSSTNFYTVETRRFAGYDDHLIDEAVIIHKVDTTRADRLAQVVDIDNNGYLSDAGAMWTPGEIFTDLETGLQISIGHPYSTGYRVTINTNPDTFSPYIDFLSPSSRIFGSGGGSVSVQVEAANYRAWSARSNTEWIRVTSGGNSIGPGSVSYVVTANSSPTFRTGTLTIGGWTVRVTQAGTDSELDPEFEGPAEILENPAPGSFQSGIGSISGWACHANEIVIELDGMPLKAGYGTTRPDTRSVCGDANNGFSLLWNWNNLGPGPHTVRALLDGQEFADTTVHVTTFGEQFLRGASGTFDLPDFPASGETTVVRWEEALQNFVITDGHPNTGGGYNRVAGVSAILENPSLGSAQSGLGAISGWACEAGEIVIELDGMPLQAGYGTTREDTRSVCGDTDNGFSLLWNWNNLGPGPHTVRALLDGQEFANTTVRVTTFGEPFLQGVSGVFPIPDFPRPGENKRLQWEESLQNFVIIP